MYVLYMDLSSHIPVYPLHLVQRSLPAVPDSNSDKTEGVRISLFN